MTEYLEYRYHSANQNPSHDYLLPHIKQIVERRRPSAIFDLGCGNGSVAAALNCYAPVVGVDPSETAILMARQAYPQIRFEQRSAYDDLRTEFGRFSMVVSLEVVEHLYDPRKYTRNMFRLVAHGGSAVISTPYHGYLKNCALALSGQMDNHFTALWDGGHIKFWSVRTLSALLLEAGFKNISFLRVGRIPPLAKSLIAIAQKP